MGLSELGRPHPDHGRALDLALVVQPLEGLLQGEW